MSYFYKIQEIATGKYYVGCRYAIHADVSDLGTTYFTSSKYVRSKDWSEFRVCYTKVVEDVRSYESRYLRRCLSFMGREKFMDIMINRNIAPGILNTPESLAKANGPTKRAKNSQAAKQRIKNGTHNFLVNEYKHSPEWYAKIKDRMLSDRNPSKNPQTLIKRVTDEFRRKQAEGSRGNTNVRGKRWWNDGTTRKRSKESPGQGWVEGYQLSNQNEEPQTNG
jgi:hypothetical protein